VSKKEEFFLKKICQIENPKRAGSHLEARIAQEYINKKCRRNFATSPPHGWSVPRE